MRATYFDGRTAHAFPVTLSIDDGNLVVSGEGIEPPRSDGRRCTCRMSSDPRRASFSSWTGRRARSRTTTRLPPSSPATPWHPAAYRAGSGAGGRQCWRSSWWRCSSCSVTATACRSLPSAPPTTLPESALNTVSFEDAALARQNDVRKTKLPGDPYGADPENVRCPGFAGGHQTPADLEFRRRRESRRERDGACPRAPSS